MDPERCKTNVRRYNRWNAGDDDWRGEMRMGRRTNSEIARDVVFYALPVYLPFYPSLLLDGMGRALIFLLLALLLLFVASRKAEIGHFLGGCWPRVSCWIPNAEAAFGFIDLEYALALPSALRLAPQLPRPPPNFLF
jgi:hypothetical protein